MLRTLPFVAQMARRHCVFWAVVTVSFVLGAAIEIAEPGRALAADAILPAPDAETPAERGYRWLTTKAYIPVAHDQETFDDLWKVWEEPARSKAAKATVEERRKMAFSRYGLTESPNL